MNGLGVKSVAYGGRAGGAVCVASDGSLPSEMQFAPRSFVVGLVVCIDQLKERGDPKCVVYVV